MTWHVSATECDRHQEMVHVKLGIYAVGWGGRGGGGEGILGLIKSALCYKLKHSIKVEVLLHESL